VSVAVPFQWQARRTDLQQLVSATVVLMALSVFTAEGDAQHKPAIPAEQYKLLRKEYERASSSGVP
jgi:hypothetical protein